MKPFILILVFCFILAGCGGSPPPPPVDNDATIQAAVASTLAAQPTDPPTLKPVPTNTPLPTNTHTPTPTLTLEATSTTIFEPLHFDGQGSEVLPFKISGPVIYIFSSKHSDNGVFFVDIYNSAGDMQTAASCVDVCQDEQVISFKGGDYLLQVEAGGAWTVTGKEFSSIGTPLPEESTTATPEATLTLIPAQPIAPIPSISTPAPVTLPTVPPTPPPSQGCCKVCGASKACGDSCISSDKQCHKPPGCACEG